MGIGFIGLGNIGGPMAKRLLRQERPVWVYDVMPAAMTAFAELGAHTGTPVQLAAQCDVIGICVRDENDVEALLRGPAGLLANAAPGTVLAIHSTVTQDALLGWHRDGLAHSIHIIDAPITGGATGAENGTLCYMVGGDAAILERCRAGFATSGERIIHAGAIGAGIALKLCNNLMSYAAFTAIHEARKLALACGLAPELLQEVGKSNGVVTAQMVAFIDGRERAAAAGGAEAVQKFFGPVAALGRKDLNAALKSAQTLGVQLPLTEQNYAIIEDVFLNR